MTVKEKIAKIEQRIYKNEECFKGWRERQNKRIRELRKICPHITHTFYPDASGNNDSDYVCNDCGKDLTSLECKHSRRENYE